jgi:hypothetical protein
MNEITRCNKRTWDGQASQACAPLRNIEEGVKNIEKILQKDLLCRHDIYEINRTYREVDLLERRIDLIPKYNNRYVIEKISEKIKMILNHDVAEDQISNSKNLISLYHLQNFSGQRLPIEKCFNIAWDKFEKNPMSRKNIAIYLPDCCSEGQFDKDFSFFIGLDSDKKIDRISNRKKRRLQDFTQTTEIKSKFQDHPAYFDELMDNGYPHLCEHLIRMRSLTSEERDLEMKKITFLQLSCIVLETREAIIQKVISSVPSHCKNTLFLLGRAGEGKSTTLCCLRGDKMDLKGFSYESKDDKNQLIGHSPDTSHTFLPNIKVVNDLVIVDFPGLIDTNSPFISLGIECALKALVTKYAPKILVIESITNIGGRGEIIADMGSRLQRLLDNKKDCTLGITKYSLDPHFGKLIDIENQQKRDQSAITQDEIRINNEIEQHKKTIEDFSQINHESLKPHIENNRLEILKKEQILQNIKREKIELSDQVNKEILKIKNGIENSENTILKKIGLENMIRFMKIEEPNCSSTFIQDLVNKKSIHVNSKNDLDPSHEKLIEDIFFSDLIKKIQDIDDFDFDVENFEQSIKESSLISTIFSESHPEIGEFLHLPEINPDIIRKFNKEILDPYVDNYMKSIILEIDTAVIEIIQGKLEQDNVKKLQGKLDKLKNYVLLLNGVKLDDKTQEEIEISWNNLQNKIKQTVEDKNEKNEFDVPAWIKILIGHRFEIPGIRKLIIWREWQKVGQQVIQETFDACCLNLDQVYETLLKLQELKALIKKREEIETAFDSVEISIASMETLKKTILQKIEKVRNAYGASYWEKRVQFFADDMDLSQFNQGELLCIAYGIIDRMIEKDVINIPCYSDVDLKQSPIFSHLLSNEIMSLLFDLSKRYKIRGEKVTRALIATAVLKKWWCF